MRTVRSAAYLSATFVAAALYSSASPAQQLGRLFTSPAERVSLDSMRHGGKVIVPASAAVEAAEPMRAALPAAEGDQIVIVNGIVTRSGSGRATTWINAVPHDAAARLAGGMALARGRSNAAVVLTLRSGRQVDVKAGQGVDAVSGRISEGGTPPR